MQTYWEEERDVFGQRIQAIEQTHESTDKWRTRMFGRHGHYSQISTPAQQQQNNTIGSASLAATMDLYGVTAYSAWDPYIDPTGESRTDSSLGNIAIRQLFSSSTLRIPIHCREEPWKQ